MPSASKISINFCTEVWNVIYGLFGKNDFQTHVFGTSFTIVGCFIVFNTAFILADITGHPKWILKYKVQEGKNTPVNMAKLWNCIKTVARNLLLITPLFCLGCYPLAVYLGSFHTGQLPSFQRFCIEFVSFCAALEVIFYYSHRLLHLPQFYASCHKQHHEWKAPIGITSTYCGVLEMLMTNLVSSFAGPMLMRSHILVAWFWMSLVLLSTTIAHSGYHLPFLTSPEAHDYHHKVFNCWYGSFGVLDWLHKTDRPFVGSIFEKRNYTSFSLTPVKILLPEQSEVSSARQSEVSWTE